MKKLFKKVKNWLKKLFGLEKKVAAGGTGAGVTPAGKYRKVVQGSTQGWYGRVNYWMKSRSILSKELDAIVKHGATGYMIELAGWANSTGKMWTDSWLKSVEQEYNWLLDECRARKLWLFVSIVNDNMGKGKYGDKGPELSKVYAYAQKLVKIVKNGGKDGVYVQVVAETQTATGRVLEQYAVQQLAGFNLVYNGNGGHPTGPIVGMSNYAVHPGKVAQSNPAHAFVISDHGNIIRELANGAINGRGNPDQIKKWATLTKAKGCPVCGYYAFQVQEFDNDAIKALGNALK